MKTKRTHVVIPSDLVEEIEMLVGPRAKSKFIVSAVNRELKRIKQGKALDKARGAWKDEDHPELNCGSEEWVKKIRQDVERAIES